MTIEVGGQRLRLSANADPQHLESLASLVNERVEAVSRSARGAGTPTVLALVALDLADEVLASRRRVDDAKTEANARVEAAEARAKEVERAARDAVAEALVEIDRALADDAAEAAPADG